MPSGMAGCAAIVYHTACFVYKSCGRLVMDTVNISTPRAQKARLALKIGSKNFFLPVIAIGIISFAVGMFLLFKQNSAGYAVLMPAVFALMIRVWKVGELDRLAEEVDGKAVEDILDPEILGRLNTSSPSAYDVWQAAKTTNDRWFFEARYRLPPDIFEQALNKQPGSSAAVWQEAMKLAEKYSTHGITASVAIMALLQTIPSVDRLLKVLKMDMEDLEEGVEWLKDIDAKRRLAREKKSFGGWARDWSFGYAPTLKYLGHNISEEIELGGFFADTKMHARIVDQMVKSISSGTRSITLVGDIGTGKTTCVYAFAERILGDGSLPENIRYNQVVGLDAPSLVAQATRPGELERIILRILNEAQKAKNIILFFDEAEAFFGAGTASVDLTNILIPAMDSGIIKLIFTMTPKEWQSIGADNSSLASKFQPIQVQSSNEADTIHVLRDEILLIEHQKKVFYTYQALHEAYKLGSRYVDNQAMPGAALSVLKSAAALAQNGLVTDEVVKQSIESSYGVKLQQAGKQETDVLLNMEDELHKYVINQKQAVGVIANALRRSRSGVGNPERPAGTFLFLGPTGVGKTELSKALARVYFGDEKAMVRVDMNQFVNPEDVNRLITPMLGEQLGFLGQVRRQPFSVILLDEIEKAHKNVVNLLLQTLDEGVMRDIDNKPVSFKDAIIIATSNAGADEIRRLIDEGEDVAKLQQGLVDLVIDRGIFAPELINRFDEVVVFRPLTPEELVKVIDLIIDSVNKTLDAQKVRIELTEEAKVWLVNKGYDAKLGARPMRRVVQRYVENILAKRLLEKTAAGGSKIILDVKDFEEISED